MNIQKKAVHNSVKASAYILGVVLFMNYIFGMESTLDSNPIIIPTFMLSLLTLSVAVMGYLFFYEPTMLFLNKKKSEAVSLFLQTVGMFAGITILIILVALSGFLS
jgi:hypothetical protein